MSKTRAKREGGKRRKSCSIKRQKNPGPEGNRTNKEVFAYSLDGTSKKFGRAVGVRARKDSGQCNSQSGNMSQRIQIGGAVGIADPKSFLTRCLKAGVIAFTFRTRGISNSGVSSSPGDFSCIGQPNASLCSAEAPQKLG